MRGLSYSDFSFRFIVFHNRFILPISICPCLLHSPCVYSYCISLPPANLSHISRYWAPRVSWMSLTVFKSKASDVRVVGNREAKEQYPLMMFFFLPTEPWRYKIYHARSVSTSTTTSKFDAYNLTTTAWRISKHPLKKSL